MSDTENKVIDLMAALRESLKGVCPVCAGRRWRQVWPEKTPCDACKGTGKLGAPDQGDAT